MPRRGRNLHAFTRKCHRLRMNQFTDADDEADDVDDGAYGVDDADDDGADDASDHIHDEDDSLCW